MENQKVPKVSGHIVTSHQNQIQPSASSVKVVNIRLDDLFRRNDVVTQITTLTKGHNLVALSHPSYITFRQYLHQKVVSHLVTQLSRQRIIDFLPDINLHPVNDSVHEIWDYLLTHANILVWDIRNGNDARSQYQIVQSNEESDVHCYVERGSLALLETFTYDVCEIFSDQLTVINEKYQALAAISFPVLKKDFSLKTGLQFNTSNLDSMLEFIEDNTCSNGVLNDLNHACYSHARMINQLIQEITINRVLAIWLVPTNG